MTFILAFLLVAGVAASADAQLVTRTIHAQHLGPIPRCGTPSQLGFSNNLGLIIQSVQVSLTLVATDVRHLQITMSYGGALTVGVPAPIAGQPTALNGTYTFEDSASADFWSAVTAAPALLPDGAYRVTNATGAVESIDGTFAGQAAYASGIDVRVAEDCSATGPAGMVMAASVTITGVPLPLVAGVPAFVPIPDSPGGPQQPGVPADVTFTVPAGRGSVQSVAVAVGMSHPWGGEVVAELEAPDGTSHVLFGYTGATDGGHGSATALGLLCCGYVFSDRASASWWQAAAAAPFSTVLPGSYRTSQPGGPGSTGAPTSIDAAFAGTAAEGRWRLRVRDGGPNGTGYVGQATLALTTTVPVPPPVTAPDAFGTPFDTRLDVSFAGLLGNDTYDFLERVLLDAPPASGALTLGQSGNFVYTPAPGFVGRDSFSYRLESLTGTSGPAVVTIDVAAPPNVPPTLQTQRTYAAAATSVGLIPRAVLITGGEGSGVLCTGPGLTIPLDFPDDLLVRDVRLTVTAAISAVELLSIALTPPNAPLSRAIAFTRVGQPGGQSPFVGTYSFSDRATQSVWDVASQPQLVPPGTYRGSDVLGNWTRLTEADVSARGTWTVHVFEYCHTGVQGRIDDVSLTIEGLQSGRIHATPSTLGAIPDGPAGVPQPGPPLDVTFDVPAGRGAVEGVVVSVTLSHSHAGDLDMTLVAPDGTRHLLLGAGVGGFLNATVTFTDRSTRPLTSFNWTSGSLRTSAAAPNWFVPTVMDVAFRGLAAEGVWTLRLTDRAQGQVGTITAASLVLLTTLAPESPMSLRVAATDGRRVTLRWAPPVFGPPPDAYVIEGGIAPGQTLASITTTTAVPLLSVTAPPGVFFVRVHALSAGVKRAASNEVRLVVDVPEAPSAPAAFVGAADGQTVNLAWRNTFDGGAPTSLVLEVSGTLSGAVPLPLGEAVAFDGVPPGTYALAVRPFNAAGAGTASNGVSLSVPGTCTAPAAPDAFLAFAAGNVLHLWWDPPLGGGPATSYELRVSGAFTGVVPMAGRSIAGAVGPGAYTFQVAARNSCGTGPPTAAQTVVVP